MVAPNYIFAAFSVAFGLAVIFGVIATIKHVQSTAYASVMRVG
jgi:hypothetical protein